MDDKEHQYFERNIRAITAEQNAALAWIRAYVNNLTPEQIKAQIDADFAPQPKRKRRKANDPR